MDTFQGSIPLNFISFRLDNQTSEIENVPNPSGLPQTISNEGTVPSVADIAKSAISPQSVESEVDVNAYAEAKVQEMEVEQSQMQQRSPSSGLNLMTTNPEASTSTYVPQSLVPVRSSTPIPVETAGISQASLHTLEAGLTVVNNPGSQLPELLPATEVGTVVPPVRKTLDDEDGESSVYEVPMLPTQEHKVRFLTDLSEAEKTTGEASSTECPSLYGDIPGMSESGGETSECPDTTVLRQHQTDPQASTSQGFDIQPPELSGRARAILKTYFDETHAFRFPPGQTAVAFTESQVYHLLRVLTDETLRMSHSTMERMILDAVRGSPTVAPSRTDHFKSRTRAQTPYREPDSDSSDAETGDLPTTDSEGHDTIDRGTLGDSSSFGESDSAGEMALISASFKTSAITTDVPIVSPTEQLGVIQTGSQETDRSSQDITLSEVREQSLRSRPKSMSKKAPKTKRPSQRGVPTREEFFAKIGRTRSFISGPADPIHNPFMVWCHICKKNFSIRSKGTVEILRHHRTEKHLRRDQRWRYEHLKSTDPVTLKTQHRVRGRNGKILSKIELAKELPKFIHVDLVDIGERFPFYEDFIRGRTTPLVTPESRARTQLSMVADFIQSYGDITVLRSMWAKISSVTDHQASLCDFDWGEERMTVSIICFPFSQDLPLSRLLSFGLCPF